MKRAIRLEGLGQELVLSKATALKTTKNMIHLDQLNDGTWRLVFNDNMIPDFSKLTAMVIVREDDPEDV